MEVRSIFYDKIRRKQFEDKKLRNLREKVLYGEPRETALENEGVFRI